MGALDGAGMATELGHLRAILVGDADVVDPRAPLARDFARGRGQPVADMDGDQIGHAAMLRHGALVVAVAGEGEGAVGEGEDIAAMAVAVTVRHRLGDGHRQPGGARRDLLEGHVQPLARRIVGPHRRGRGLGKLLRGHFRDGLHWPLNSGLRFSRKAVTPSA
ncbi:hypothetical protein SDC9_49088 [bioreactor metagenome]|uniref:Uncharacterized protein n=1 Tax=bioreactor metagenome TaxID=1076179 RepID=A0A644WK92_9ZZZZ